MKVAISVALLPTYGIMAIAIGTAIPELISSLVLVPALTTRCAGVPLGLYYREAFVPPLLGAISLAACLAGLNSAIAGMTWPLLIAKVGAGLALYGAVCLFTCLDRQQRGALSERLGRIVRTRTAV